MSVEAAIKKMLQERATLPIGNPGSGDVTQPKQGSSQPNPAEQESEDAPGTTTAQGIKQTGLPIGNPGSGEVGGKPAQGSSGENMPEIPAPARPDTDPGKPKQGSSDIVAPGLFDSVQVKADVAALFAGQTNLAEGFVDKATSLFEAAVVSRVNSEMINVKTILEANAEKELVALKAALNEQVNAYLTEMVKAWAEENKLAIDQGLKQEVSESFMSGLRDLFAEHYIEVPENKVDVLESLTSELETSRARINEEVNSKLALQKELTDLKKQAVIAEASKGMTATDADRLLALVEGVEFDSNELYAEKIGVIKEQHFKKTPKKSAEMLLAESSGSGTQENTVSPSVQRYVDLLNRNKVGNPFSE